MDKDRDAAPGLMEKLNEEGKDMVIEYISYLVMSGRYPANDNRNDTCTHRTPHTAYRQ